MAWEIAVGQYGYVRSSDATAAGIPLVELGKLARNERLTNVGYGVYRFPEFPASSLDQFFEAVARVGDGAHLHSTSVLHLHGLAQLNPSTMVVGCARRVRRTLPAWVEVVRVAVPVAQLTEYEGVPSATVARALQDCRGVLIGERFIAAIDEARARGLLSAAEARALEVADGRI